MTLSDVAFGLACFSLGFVLATVMWLRVIAKRDEKVLSNYLTRYQTGLGQGVSNKEYGGTGANKKPSPSSIKEHS